jgi:hypothetical protein
VGKEVQPDALVGRRVRVQFDKGWYEGTVNQYMPDCCKHTVRFCSCNPKQDAAEIAVLGPHQPHSSKPQIVYDDGDEETSILAQDDGLEILLDRKEQLLPPSADDLEAIAAALAADAQHVLSKAASSRQKDGTMSRALRADPKSVKEGKCCKVAQDTSF